MSNQNSNTLQVQDGPILSPLAPQWGLMNAIPFPLIVARLSDGSVLFANQNASDLFGVPMEQVIGNVTPDFFANPKDRPRYIRILQEKGQVEEAEFQLKKGNGTIFWGSLSTEITKFDGETATVTVVKDLSEQKLAEQRAAETQESYRQMVEGALIGIFRSTMEGTMIEGNQTILDLTGYDSIEDVNTVGLWNVYHDPAALQEMLHNLQTNGEIFNVRVDMIHKKGHLVHAILNARLVIDHDGKPIYLDGTLEDITDRKLAEQALRESEERYQAIFDASPVMFWLKDAKNGILQINRAAAEFEGVDPKEVEGKSCYDVYPQEQAEAFYQDDLEVIQSGQPKLGIIEEHTTPGTGHTMWLETGKVPIRNDEGEVTGVLALAVDITQQKQAEQTLEESEKRFRTLFNDSADAYLIIDEGRFVDCNQATVEMLQASNKQEVLDTHPSELSPEYQPDGQPSGPKADEMIRIALEEGSHRFEWVHRRVDGKDFPVEVLLTPISTGGKTVIHTVWRDITNRQQREQAIEDSQRLLQLVMDNIPQAVFWKDKTLTYLGANQAFAEDAGLDSPQDLIGKTDYDMPWQEQAELYRADDQQVMDEGKPKLNFEEPQTGPTGEITWLRTSKVPMIDDAGNIFAVLGMYEDITEQKSTEQTLQRRVEIEELLTTVSSKFVIATVDEIDDEINQALELLSAFSKADRSYLFLIQDDQATMSNTHEWCAPGVESHIEDLQEIPIDTFPWLMEKLQQFEVVDITRVTEMPPEASAEKDEFQAEGIQSIIMVPIAYQGKLAGFMGYDAVSQQRTWENDTITALRSVGETLIATIERKNLQLEIQEAFERRGYQVQISTEISQEISEATELTELFDQVVDLTKERLGYYHTQLLRYDPNQDAVILISGYGETGQQMAAQGHRMALGSGLIGTAAETGETVLRPDLAADPDWQPNPLLPETRGEVAVPIKLGDQILGVLDIQSDTAGALTEDDQLLLEGLCGQIAIAIEQTRLRQEMTERLEEINRLYRAMSQEGWETYQTSTTLPEGFQFDQAGVRAVVRGDDAQSAVSAPLTVPGGHAIGALEISDDPENPLSPEDQVFLEQVSEQVALALESARLFEQTQAALYAVQESETQLSEAMRIANMANWVFDLTTMAFTFNDRVFELLGTSSEEMGGYQVSAEKYVQEFVHPEDAGIIPQAVQEALASDDPVNFRGHVEYRLKRGDGAERYISSDYRLEVNDQGQPTHGIGSLMDITERREAEEAVRQAQERFELSVSGSNDGIWDWNIPTNEVYYSTRLKEMIGYSDEDFTNDFAEFEEKLHPDDHDRVMATVGEYLEGKIETYEPEFRFRHKDGSYRWILARGIVIRDESGLPIRMAGSHTDVTERRLQEQATARRAAELATVANIGTTISTILEENQLLETVVQLTRERFDLYHCHIFLADEKNQTLQVKACGWEDDSPHDGTTEDVLIHTDQEQSLVAQAVREQQAVIVNNVRQDPNWLPNKQLPDTQSEMAIPLVAGNQVLGVLDVQDIETERFTDEDISIMTTLASQVAVALQNARTYALTQQQADQEAMINLISQRIQSTTSVESALQVAIRELGRALGAKRTNIQLGLPSQNKDQ